MSHTTNIIGSVVASTVRSWRGTSASRIMQQPAEMPILFDREGDSDCRLVREVFTELNLDVEIFPYPEGGQRFEKKLKELSGSNKIPFLVDHSQKQNIGGAQQIVDYLFQQYRKKPSPSSLSVKGRNKWASKLASKVRRGAGINARPSKKPDQLMTLYSFESSPYSRPVRELLCELEIPYQLINLGKQQRADMGPAKFHFTLKPYKPLPDTKRSVFFEKHGNVQVPYLIDPNTERALFESEDILKYLRNTYAL